MKDWATCSRNLWAIGVKVCYLFQIRWSFVSHLGDKGIKVKSLSSEQLMRFLKLRRMPRPSAANIEPLFDGKVFSYKYFFPQFFL